MKKWIIAIIALGPNLIHAAGAGGINLYQDPKALLRSTNTFTAAQTFSSITVIGACGGCSSGGGSADNLGSHVATGTLVAPFSFETSSFVAHSSATAMGEITSTTGFIGNSSTMNFVYAGTVTVGSFLTASSVVANGFTASASTMGQIGFSNGAVGSPPIYFGSASRRTGIYGVPNDEIDIGSIGSQIIRFTFNSVALGSGISLRINDGTLLAPAMAFANSTQTGFWRDALSNAYINGPASGIKLRLSAVGKVGITLGGTEPARASVHITSATGPDASASNLALLSVSSGTGPTRLEIWDSSTTLWNSLTVISSNSFLSNGALSISSTTNNYHVKFTTTGHMSFNGSSPTISNCGTSPSGACIACTDQVGTVQIGGTAPTACTITFQVPYSNLPGNPSCTVSDNSTTVGAGVTTLTNVALTVGFPVGGLAGGVLYYRCNAVSE